MSFNPRQIAKGPLFITAALLALYPICIAEATSYASQQQSQQTPRTALETLKQSRLQTSQGLLLPASSDLPSLSSLQSTLQDYRSQLSNLRPLIQDQTKLTPLLTLIDQLEALLTKATDLQTQYAKDLEALNQATIKHTDAQEVLRLTTAALTNATTAESAAQTSYDEALLRLEQATNDLTAKRQALTAATTASETTQQDYDAALQTFNEATSNVAAAQDAYDNNLIPDPTWTHPTEQVQHVRQIEHTRQVPVTTLVPHTTYTTTGGVKAEVFNRLGYNNAPPLPSANEVPISTQMVSTINFYWDYILNSGRNEDVIVKFTGNLLFPTDGYYQFYTPADDGTKLTVAGVNLIDDWYDKGGGGSTSQQIFMRGGVPYPFTLYYYENGGGASVSLQYYSLSTPYFQLVPASAMGTSVQETTTYTEEITYQTETYYTEEIYYTTEPVTSVEKTLQVDIREGGQATFTAPAGATFISSNLRYESYNNPTCGANIYPNVNGKTSVTLQALNSVYGDPCGGQVKHITGTLTYLSAPTAPLIKNPALLIPLQEANAALAEATRLLSETATANQEASATKEEVTQEVQVAQDAKDSAAAEVLTSSSNLSAASSSKLAVSQQHDDATSNEASSKESVRTAEIAATSTKTKYTENHTKATSTSAQVQTVLSNTKPDPIPEPEPEPTPEPEPVPQQELPENLSVENLQEIDLTQIDPTTITEEQVTALQEAAYETFETAEQGSAEYEQALDALFLAAEADDIVLDPQLAAIPGLAGAVEALNFLGNAGADMSPKVREESEKVVVTAVVAAGAAIQSAAAAASMSSASTRKIGN